MTGKVLIENNYIDEVFVYPKVFTPEQCKMIATSHYLRNSTESICMDDYGKANRYILKQNEKTHWLRRVIMKYVNMANENYKFDISYLDTFQLLEYDKGCYFDWHIDIAGKDEYDYIHPAHITLRKINTVTFLSDINDYEGGQLTFNMSNNSEYKDIPQEQGTLVLFPSYLAHKVELITGGLRHTLSTLVYGNSFC